MKKFLKDNRKGFTLIELLVVIAILAVLATLYVPRIVSSSNNAKKTVEIANARTLASEITMINASATKVFKGSGTVPTSAAGDNWGTYATGYNVVQASDITNPPAALGLSAKVTAEIKGLLDGRGFPSDAYVYILTDAKGNCFIVDTDGNNIKAN